MIYQNKTRLNFLTPEDISEFIVSDFGIKTELTDKKELVQQYLELAEKATSENRNIEKNEDKKFDYKDLIFSEFGISIFPKSWEKETDKFEFAYNRLMQNGGDDTFIRQQAISELEQDGSSKNPNKRRKKKSVTKMTLAEQRKYLMRMIKVKIVRSSSETVIPRGDLVNRKEVLPVAWGNSKINETTQVPLGIETFIHYGAFLNLKNAYKINVIVDENSGSFNDILEETNRNSEFDITILEMPTIKEIENEKMKQALIEQSAKQTR